MIYATAGVNIFQRMPQYMEIFACCADAAQGKNIGVDRSLTMVIARNARATLAAAWSSEKLFRMFPCVSRPKLK